MTIPIQEDENRRLKHLVADPVCGMGRNGA
jgi:hypothetical protein